MTNALSNPQKRTPITYPLDSTKESLKFIVYLDYNYILKSTDDNSNKYIFESRKFLKEGAYIDVMLLPISESGTEMTIEIRKIQGAFEKDRESKSAGNHISDVEMLVANILKLSPEQKEMYKGVEASTTKAKGLKEFTCKACKKAFYANRKITPIAICPHCKTRNLINANDNGSGWGSFISLALEVSNIFTRRKN